MATHSSTLAWKIPWTEEPGRLQSMAMDCSTPGFPVLHHLPELAQTHVGELVMPSNHLVLCHPLLLPSVFPSIRVFSRESALCLRWPKYWSFSFNISPSNEYSGPVGSPCSPRDSQESSPTPHSSKASVLQHSAFVIVQLSHPFMLLEKP